MVDSRSWSKENKDESRAPCSAGNKEGFKRKKGRGHGKGTKVPTRENAQWFNLEQFEQENKQCSIELELKV